MSRCALIVEFTLLPDTWPQFQAIMAEHAAKTLAEEPGCRQFDLLRPEHADGTPDESRAILVEVYDDRAAYDAHRAGPRMPGVGAAIAPLLAGRTLTICRA